MLVVKAEESLTCALENPVISRDPGALICFLDQEFDGQLGLLSEFPLLIGCANPAGSWVILADQLPVSHAAWRPITLLSHARPIRAVGIGLVTTHSDYRGRGLAGQVVNACLDAATGQGAEVAFLFAETRKLYSELGFAMAGRERLISLNKDYEPQKNVREAFEPDATALLPLLEDHPLRARRTPDEFAALLSIPETHVYVWEEANQIRAYCIEGKGRDLRGVIHEWGGDARVLDPLLRTVATLNPRASCVLGPADQEPPLDDESSIEPLAQFKILKPDVFGTADPCSLFGNPETPPTLPIYIWGLDSV